MDPLPHWSLWLTLWAVLVMGAVTDIRYGIIPNWLSYGAIVLGLGTAAWMGGLDNGFSGIMTALGSSFLAMLIVGGPFAVMFSLGGFGGGDVKLMAGAGAIIAHIPSALTIMFYALLVSAVMALIVMFARRIVGRTFARLGHAVLLSFYRLKPQMPTDSPRIPFAFAMMIGAIIAGVEMLARQPAATTLSP